MLNSLFAGFSPKIIKNIHTLDCSVNPEYGNEEINELLNKTVLLGGKRLRPLLTFLMADLFQETSSKVAICAKSIEQVHAASLAHDDVIDLADMRRSKKSINAESSNKKAILAGDYLLANVIVELSALGNLNLVQEMSYVIQSLAHGEWLQVRGIETRDYSRDFFEEISLNKTSSVLSWCCVAPAIISNQSPLVIEMARELGNNLGIAFQFIDDVIDFSKSSGKGKNLDVENDLVNSVIYEWILLKSERKEYLTNKEIKLADIWEEEGLDQAQQTILSYAEGKLNNCKHLVEKIAANLSHDSEKAMGSLFTIIDYLGKRKH